MQIHEAAHEAQPEPIVVLLLNGHLKGCEFTLLEGTTRFIVSDEETLRQQALEKTPRDTTIFVPVDSGGINFEIILSGEAAKVRHNPLGKPGSSEGDINTLIPNKITYVGSLALAIRDQNATWDDDVTNFMLEEKTHNNSHGKSQKKKNNYTLALATVLLFIIAACTAAYQYFINEEKKITEISAVLGLRKNDYTYYRGGDNTVYVFSYNNEDKNWAQQAFMRTTTSSVVKVTDILSEEDRLSRWLKFSWPDVKLLRVKLIQARQLDLVLSKERGGLSPQQQQSLMADIKKRFFYIERINVSTLSDRFVMNEAEQGIKKIAVPYTKIKNHESITFSIQGDIDDSQLERVKSCVQNFGHRWGEGYIQFVIELKKDWLADKSYKYGSEGYVKMSSSHWYFPKK